MKFHIVRNEDRLDGDTIEFSGSFNMNDLLMLKIGYLDQLLLRTAGPGSKPSDYLTALEMIYRRYEEEEAKRFCAALVVSECE